MEINGRKDFPFLAIRRRILFPGNQIRLTIGRPKSKRLAQSLWDKKNSLIFISTYVPLKSETEYEFESIRIPDEAGQFEDDKDDVDEHKAVYKHGVVAKIVNISKLKENFSMLVEGIVRAEFVEFTSFSPYFTAKIKVNTTATNLTNKEKALILNLRKAGSKLTDLMRKGSSGKVRKYAKSIISIAEGANGILLPDVFALVADAKLEERQKVLAEKVLEKRLEFVIELVNRHIEIFNLSDKIQSNMEDKLKNTQREFLLKQQIKAIQSELDDILKERGEQPNDKSDYDELKEKVFNLSLTEETRSILDKELNRLKTIQPSQPEYNVIKTFLNIAVELPWNTFTEDNIDIIKAKAQLERDHFGLDKVKKRILEFLAVMALNKQAEAKTSTNEKFHAPILCLAGAPGVGKTSLGKSVAKALGRKFARISLGGVRDEAEIRGHRRTYIGAMPGKLIATYRKCGSLNPVILLDEIDKVATSHAAKQGDVSAALLEVLDPEQNNSFSDHYLGFPFDLSQTLFIATANDLSTIPAPLMDRMEIIEIPSYTTKEKIQIAKNYLVPRQLNRHSLANDIVFNENALKALITNYTREAGVRSLERQIAAVCRDLAVKELKRRNTTANEINSMGVMTESESEDSVSTVSHNSEIVIDSERVEDILGVKRFVYDSELHNLQNIHPGVSIGLAYTQFGGDILFIESALHYGSGKISLTGRLGQVMSESVNAAFTFIKSNTVSLNLKAQFHNIQALLSKIDLHVHFPSGGVPKDGPSAGVAICASILSALTGRLVRSDTACTGEISLRGQVLPVGGIKEKVLAAHRAGIKRVLLPKANAKDISEIPPEIKATIEVIPCDTVLEAISHLFKEDDDISNKPKWYYDLPDEELGIRGGDVVLKSNLSTKKAKHKKGIDLAGPILRSQI